VDCLYRANISAGTAIGANIRINLIDVTFRNGINRALIDAGAAGGAIICDYVSHLFSVLVNTLQYTPFQAAANLL
jgi:hypothetical protein